MDPLVKAMAAITRSIDKIVGSVESKEDKLLVIQMAERKVAEIKKALAK